MEVIVLIRSLNYLGLLLCIISIYLLFSKGLNKNQFWGCILFYLLLQIAIEVPADVLSRLQKNNMPLLHIYVLLEFIILSTFYRFLLSPYHGFWLKFSIYFILLISILIVVNSFLIQDFMTFNSYAKTLTNVLFLSYSVLYFYFLLQRDNELNPYESGFILINAAVLFYYSASLFVFMTGQIKIIATSPFYIYIWVFNSIASITMRVLIFIAIWKAPQFLSTKS